MYSKEHYRTRRAKEKLFAKQKTKWKMYLFSYKINIEALKFICASKYYFSCACKYNSPIHFLISFEIHIFTPKGEGGWGRTEKRMR